MAVVVVAAAAAAALTVAAAASQLSASASHLTHANVRRRDMSYWMSTSRWYGLFRIAEEEREED